MKRILALVTMKEVKMRILSIVLAKTQVWKRTLLPRQWENTDSSVWLEACIDSVTAYGRALDSVSQVHATIAIVLESCLLGIHSLHTFLGVKSMLCQEKQMAGG